MKDTILEVKNLNTSFVTDKKRVRIIRDVSFDLKRGSTLAIVGESGCGKSVTIHSIVNLLPKNAIIESDKIVYNKKIDATIKKIDIGKLDRYGKEMRMLRGASIGMIFQDPMSSLNPVHKIGDQVAEGLIYHKKISKKEAKKEVIKMFLKLGIPDPEIRYNNYPHEFSGGMKQRVVIAIAMICNPDIIIADEPTTALDVTIQAQIMELMKSLQIKDEKSIIMITHNMGLVAEIADEVCVMYMGRIMEVAPVKEIFENPSHPYTKALLRSVPVLGLSKDAELETIDGITPNPADILTGCEFYSRCKYREQACKSNEISLSEINTGHKVRCIKIDKVLEA